jgi:hypothetical protein
MSSWLAWLAFFLVALVLGLTGYQFSLRTLRVITAAAVVAVAGYLTWYGLTYTAKPGSSLAAGFTGGTDALSTALFHALPGSTGWIIIAALLVLGYRQLEAWACHLQARSLDTSALAADRPDDTSGHGQEAGLGRQRHDQLAAELKFRLPAVQVRSPAILPGGSRAGGLASIAEASGLPVGGLAGAVISFFGMLWPGSRRLRVQVWVEQTTDCPEFDKVRDKPAGVSDKAARVTVDLDDPRTGLGVATKTLTACCIDHAASVVAGYVARYIFVEDRTAPPWCTGAADGRDLAALLIARQIREYPDSEHLVRTARDEQIAILEGVATSSQCAGVARYELAQLYDLRNEHVKALLLHAVNREQYPDFYRGRYRLAMSLEMLAQPGHTISADEAFTLDHALRVLCRCGALPASPDLYDLKAGAELPPELQADLLDAAWAELRHIRRYLSLPSVVWRSFWRRDERGILRPYWRQPYRQAFHDGVRAAQLLVAIRRDYLNRRLDHAHQRTYRPRRVRTILRVAAAIAGDSSALARELGIRPVSRPKHGARLTRTLRTRHWFRPRCTRSWQAGYNLACAYAAVAQAQHQAKDADHSQLGDLADRVVSCLWFTVCNPACEMERPWDWIGNDPDFSFMHPEDYMSGHQAAFAAFREFLDLQERRDYPFVPRPRTGRENWPARGSGQVGVARSARRRGAVAGGSGRG